MFTELTEPRRHTWGPVAAVLATVALMAGACSVSPNDVTVLDSDGSPGSVTAADPGTDPATSDSRNAAPTTESTNTGDTVDPQDTGDAAAGTDSPSRFDLVEGELPISADRLVSFVDYVERKTGRPFLRPPRIAVQNLADFNEGLAPTDEDLAKGQATAEADTRFLQALGHTQLGPQALLDLLNETLTSSDLIAGYFDPEVDTLFVPAEGAVDEQFDSTLVHELVHAIDHQYVDLQRLLDLADEAIDNRTEGRFEIFSIAEGRAAAVQAEWDDENSTPAADAADLDVFADVPASVLLSIALPYEIGQQMILQLGGPADTWYLYDDLPASSEQAFFPNKIGVDLPVDVPVPPADGAPLDQGVLGADSVLLWLLGDSLEPDPSLALSSFLAIDGWAGGSWVLWGDSIQSCLRAHVWGDTDQDLQELAGVFDAWADDSGDRGVTAQVTVDAATLEVTACAPFIP